MKHKTRKGFATILVLLVVVLVGGVGVGWYLSQQGVIPKFTGPATTATTLPAGRQAPAPPPVPETGTSPKPTGSIEAAKWQTYSGLGVSFMFPSQWRISKPILEVQKPSPGGYYQQSFDDQGGSYGLLLRIFPRQKKSDGLYETLDDSLKSVSQKTHIIVAGQDAVKVQNPDIPRAYNVFISTFSQDSQNITTLNFFIQPASQEAVDKGNLIFDQILSTFQFLP